ncbi:amidohydrolase family protein [Diaminobutyricibacter sp. McL0608]|uniref:amidohydrolase family protein n=1 Tax=Leifsonia sp. McL0608 TaxID=3143537 RepID=UPI0031F30C9B
MVADGFTLGVEQWWSGGWRDRTVFVAAGGRLHAVGDRQTDADLELPGTLFPRLIDHHVHLGLTDPSALMAGGITAVADLGWVPSEVARLRDASRDPKSGLPEVSIAGALITCPGGYPSQSSWAPPGATVEVRDAADAEAAVDAQVAIRASAIKFTMNSEAGPAPSADLAAAIVGAAHRAGLPAVVHAQGVGQARRAFEAGADRFAHTPFSERLDDDLIDAMADGGTEWVSTLDIHGWGTPIGDFKLALDNLRRFADAGGRILYGTDLGNGALPVGVNGRELLALAAAGLDRDRLVSAIAGDELLTTIGPRFAWAPGRPPSDPAAAAQWLTTSRGVTVDSLTR